MKEAMQFGEQFISHTFTCVNPGISTDSLHASVKAKQQFKEKNLK